MRRSISNTALLFTSVSAILGSGWLFAAFYTAQAAGPASLLAWLIGGGAVIIIAFVFAELSAMLPIMGSSSRIPHFTHGTIVSFLFAWIIWLAYAALVPAEVQAVIQYLRFFFPQLTKANNALTLQGYILASTLMMLMSILNTYSLRWLIRCNNFFTALKVIIPIIISIVLIFVASKPMDVIHAAGSNFMPYGLHGILAAIASGGIIFAFNGFKLACELAGEAKNPKRALPIAIIGSILLCLFLYLLLQIAFLSALDKPNILLGWMHIHLDGASSPFSAVLSQHHAKWILPLLYLGAVLGPLAAALIYVGSASRALYATSKNGYIPSCFEHLNQKGIPTSAILLNFFFGLLMFAPLPGWRNMITFLTSIMGITYAIAPVCLLALREQAPNQPRPFKLAFPKTTAFLAFYICTLITYWSGWAIISKLSVALAFGFVLLFWYHTCSKRGRKIQFDWLAATWLWPYFIGISIISYLGNFGGGRNIIPFGWDFIWIAVFCMAILYIAQRFKLPAEKTQAFIRALNLEQHT